MGTPSIIGTTDGTTFEGLTCHYDGYPTSMVPELAKIITRDGHAALPTLTGEVHVARGGATRGWESIEAAMPPSDRELTYSDSRDYYNNVPGPDRDPGTSLLYSHLSRGNEKEERDRIAEGFGVVNVAEIPGTHTGLISSPDTWIGWAYLFADDLSLGVYEIEGDKSPMHERARFTREELAALAAGDEALAGQVSQAECGERYQRCSHYAWVHDSTIPEESRNLSIGEWMGTEPMSPESATSATVGGERYELSRSGRLRGGKWQVGVKGTSEYVALFRVTKKRGYVPLPGVELFFPPTKADVAA